jgi:hypothetical protein
MSASAIHISPIADAQPYRYDLEHFVHETCDAGARYVYKNNDDGTQAQIKVLPIFDHYGVPIIALTEEQVADMKIEACGYERVGPEETSILVTETDRATSNGETT